MWVLASVTRMLARVWCLGQAIYMLRRISDLVLPNQERNQHCMPLGQQKKKNIRH